MKKVLIVFLVILMLLTSFALVGCENNNASKKRNDDTSSSSSDSNQSSNSSVSSPKITIIFDCNDYDGVVWDDKYHKRILIDANERIGSLPKPTLAGYTFDGWYDENGVKIKATTKFDGDDNIILYAKFQKSESDITSIVNDYIDKLESEDFDSMQAIYDYGNGYVEEYSFDSTERSGFAKEQNKSDNFLCKTWLTMNVNNKAYLVSEENGERTALDISTTEFYESMSAVRSNAYNFAEQAIDYLRSALDSNFKATANGNLIKVVVESNSFVFENGLLTEAIVGSEKFTFSYDVEINVPRI